MDKRSIDRTAAIKFIKESRVKAKTDKEIYAELAEQYYNKKAVALLITGTARKEDIQKYRIYNNILIGLLGLSILFKIIVVFTLAIDLNQPLALLIIFIAPLIAGFLIYEISRYNGSMYRLCGALAIVGFGQSLSQTTNTADIVINIIFAGLLVGFSFYLDKKLFPDYRPNKLKKNSDGEYF